MKTIKECVMREGIRRRVISDGNAEDLSGTKTLNVEVHSRFGPLPSHLLRSNQLWQTLEEDAITEQNLCFLACYRPPWCKNSARMHPKWKDFFLLPLPQPSQYSSEHKNRDCIITTCFSKLLKFMNGIKLTEFQSEHQMLQKCPSNICTSSAVKKLLQSYLKSIQPSLWIRQSLWIHLGCQLHLRKVGKSKYLSKGQLSTVAKKKKKKTCKEIQ